METERLIVDRIRPDDRYDYFYNISHDKRVLETFICKYAETPEEVDMTPYVSNEKMFAIRLKETGRLIGTVLYFDDRDGECEIGYGVGSGYWNKGYTTEAVNAFIDYCFFEKGFEKINASFFKGNDASKRVMEKCGMRYSFFREKELTYLGVERDLTYYSVSKKDRKPPERKKSRCSVRKAEEKDVESIIRLLGQILAYHEKIRPDVFLQGTTKYGRDDVVSLINDRNRLSLVAVDEKDGVVGYALCILKPPSEESHKVKTKILFLDDLCVDERRRGLGTGTLLFESVKSEAKKLGCGLITLNVWEGNVSARRFYAGLGMKRREEILEYKL